MFQNFRILKTAIDVESSSRHGFQMVPIIERICARCDWLEVGGLPGFVTTNPSVRHRSRTGVLQSPSRSARKGSQKR